PISPLFPYTTLFRSRIRMQRPKGRSSGGASRFPRRDAAPGVLGFEIAAAQFDDAIGGRVTGFLRRADDVLPASLESIEQLGAAAVLGIERLQQRVSGNLVQALVGAFSPRESDVAVLVFGAGHFGEFTHCSLLA